MQAEADSMPTTISVTKFEVISVGFEISPLGYHSYTIKGRLFVYSYS